jgi:hypothetical protein
MITKIVIALWFAFLVLILVLGLASGLVAVR